MNRNPTTAVSPTNQGCRVFVPEVDSLILPAERYRNTMRVKRVAIEATL